MASDSVTTDSASESLISAVRENLLGRFEETILLATIACGPFATADAIKLQMESAIGARGLTAVISTLDRLTDKGLVETSEEAEPSKRRGGRKRRLFKATETGRISAIRSISITDRLARAAGLVASDDQENRRAA